MKFCQRPMPEYSLSRQRRDYEDALPLPNANVQPSLRFDSYVTQKQSLLLSQLPIEVRLQIWQYTTGNQKIHIVNKYRRLGHAVMDDEYWCQHYAQRPSFRACSWMYTYGSLPTTKQLADNNLCDLLATCRQIYHEAEALLYSTNTFAFWDLRTVAVFNRCISSRNWHGIRSIEVYAMFYRKDDITDAVEARSLLQLEAWADACAALPDLRMLKIYLANPQYLDKQYLKGQRSNVQEAIFRFIREIKLKANLEVYLRGESERNKVKEQWSLMGIDKENLERLERHLQDGGINCELLCRSQEAMHRSAHLSSSVNFA